MADRSQRLRAEDVVREVDDRWGSRCATCELELIGHEVVLSLVLGFRDAPRCVPCLAGWIGQEPDEFVRLAAARIRPLACFRAGWVHADRRLAAEPSWPEDRIPPDLVLVVGEPDENDESDDAGHVLRPEDLEVHAAWDGGDLSCGDLVLELRRRLEPLTPGELLRVRATDPAAPRDLPSWCRLTRHVLVADRHPHYWIRRRPDAGPRPTTKP